MNNYRKSEIYLVVAEHLHFFLDCLLGCISGYTRVTSVVTTKTTSVGCLNSLIKQNLPFIAYNASPMSEIRVTSTCIYLTVDIWSTLGCYGLFYVRE